MKTYEMRNPIPVDDGTRTVDVTNCARCGMNHKDIIAHRFQYPDGGMLCEGVEYTHWGTCPNLREPIIFAFDVQLARYEEVSDE